MAASMCSCTRRLLSLQIRTCARLPLSTAAHQDAKLETETIIIPKKKKRTPTSVLEALAATVEKDPTAPRLMYHDDPYLIPSSNFAKKTFALSKASGKKAARHIVNTHPKNFNYREADPHIEALMPKNIRYRHRGATEAALKERISRRRVKDAGEVYNLLKREGVVISPETHQRLLELLCVFNSNDPPEPLLPEENFFRHDLGVETRKVSRRTWQDSGLAERVFEDMEPKTPEAFCSLIRGMAKFFQTDKAMDYYRRMKDGGMTVDLHTYNALIRIACICQDTFDSKWKLALELMEDMKQSGHQPNLATFNNALFTLSRISNYSRSPEYALQTLAEMKRCHIEPSLATWKHIIATVYNSDDVDSPILSQIVEHLQEEGQFTLRDLDDLDFFTAAMAKCFINLKDPELAKKINSIVTKGDNSLMLGDGYSEGLYYSFFFRLLCMFDDMDTIMENYEKIVPSIWTPSFTGMEELLKAVELNDGFQHLPLLWSHLVMLDYLRRPELLSLLLQLIAKKHTDSKLLEQFGDIANYLFDRWKEDFKQDNTRPLELTAANISNMITVSLQAERFDQAWSMFETFKLHNRLFSGIPSEESFSRLVDVCIDQKDAEKAITVLSMMFELGFSQAETTMQKVQTEMELTDSQRQHIDVLK